MTPNSTIKSYFSAQILIDIIVIVITNKEFVFQSSNSTVLNNSLINIIFFWTKY